MWCRYVDVNNSGWSKSSCEQDRYFYVLCFTWGRKVAPVYVVWMRAGARGKACSVWNMEGTESKEIKHRRWLIREVGVVFGLTTEKRGSENGEMMLWREKKMTLMAFGLSASSFYKKHELNIALGTAAGQTMVHHAKQSWQKHWFSPSSSSKPLH